MGALFDYASGSRVPSVPAPIRGAMQEYQIGVKAWESQAKRVKNCASSIELIYKDITRLNLLLRFLKSPCSNDLVLKLRLFTCVDIDSKLSKLLWKFGDNTVIRCDFVQIQSLPPLSDKDKKELSLVCIIHILFMHTTHFITYTQIITAFTSTSDTRS